MKSDDSQAINTAVIAFGLSGRAFHAPFLAINPAFRLQKVVERHASESVKIYPQVQVCRTLEEVLEDKAIELVVITTPNTYHHSMAKQALEAGKHVVLEKPFTVTTAEGRDLINLAKEKNKMLTVFQSRRWDGDFLTLQGLLKENALGTLVEFESHYDRYRPFLKGSWKEEPEAGGGILYDLAPHLVDQALVLFGLPRAVFADIRRQRPSSKIDDAFDLLLYYDKVKVNLRAGMVARIQRPRFLVKGTEGSYIKYGMDPQEALLRAGKAPIGEEWGLENEEDWGTLYTSRNGLTFKGKTATIAGNYGGFYHNIAAHLRKGEPLAVKPEQALQVMEVIELARKSAEEGTKLPFLSSVSL